MPAACTPAEIRALAKLAHEPVTFGSVPLAQRGVYRDLVDVGLATIIVTVPARWVITDAGRTYLADRMPS